MAIKYPEEKTLLRIIKIKEGEIILPCVADGF